MMNKVVSLCCLILAILCLSQQIAGHNIPQQQPQQQQLQQLHQAPLEPIQQRDVHIVKDIHTFLVQHPNLKLVRLYKKEPVNRSQTVKYSLGSRVSGDRIVAQYADTLLYPAVKDVTTQVTYPESGTGSVVTFVEINCLQDKNEGNAYVVAGGIGQRFISIVLEATQTERFTYNVHVFGTE